MPESYDLEHADSIGGIRERQRADRREAEQERVEPDDHGPSERSGAGPGGERADDEGGTWAG